MNLKIFCPFQYLDFQYHSYITSNQIHNSKSTICKNFEFNAKRQNLKMKRVNLHSTLLMFHLFQNKIFSKKYFHILQYLFYVKIFLANQNNYRQICVKCFTLEIWVKHFTFCALTHSSILCLTLTLSIFSLKLSPPWSFSPPITGSTLGTIHHQVYYYYST